MGRTEEAGHRISDMLRFCGDTLPKWSKEVFRNVGPEIVRTRKELLRVQHETSNEDNFKAVEALSSRLEELIQRDEIMWRQRSRALWLEEGDNNTKFFHARASQRRKYNSVRQLKKEDGTWEEDPEGIARLCRQYYQNLFTSDHHLPSIPSPYCVPLPCRVTPVMNSAPDRVFTRDEIFVALKQMHPTKAPGPDGMPPLFFQKFWSSVETPVCEAVLGVLNEGADPSQLNHTFLALIPKIALPTTCAQFRPISMCNVVFKLITKTITNRLKLILPAIISENQSAFIPGRLITDNALISQEIFHGMRTRDRQPGWMSIKLDMAKAYDRVEWDFLGTTMGQLGFSPKWISLILRCISTVSYSVLLNDTPRPVFVPQRGLRQGDPLSPYLFVICAEGLSAALQNAVDRKALQGFCLSRGGPTISHLFYADDSLIFSRASTADASII